MHMPEFLKRLLPGGECDRLLDENLRLSHEINERMAEAAGEVTRLRMNGHTVDHEKLRIVK